MTSLFIELCGTRVLLRSEFPDLTRAATRALESDGIAVSDASIPAPGEPAVTIIVRKSVSQPPDWEHLPTDLKEFRFVDGVVYRYSPGLDRYYVTAGDGIWGTIDFATSQVEWYANAFEPRYAVNLMVLDPLSLILPGQGLLICHAAAIEMNHKAALLYGKSGVGKSTISFLLSRRTEEARIRVIADDTVLLDLSADTPQIHPVYTGFGLTPAIAQEHGLDRAGCEVLFHNRGKNYYPRVPGQATGGAPVTMIVFLCKCDDGRVGTDVEQLPSGQAVLRLLAAQSSIPNPNLIKRVSWLQRLASQTTCFSLSYDTSCDLDLLTTLLTNNR
jgi:hypothetical protein